MTFSLEQLTAMCDAIDADERPPCTDVLAKPSEEPLFLIANAAIRDLIAEVRRLEHALGNERYARALLEQRIQRGLK